MPSNRPVQNLIMPRKQGGHFVRMFLREFCTAFDVGEEEGDSAGGNAIHDING
jgi:hypothetical protein